MGGRQGGLRGLDRGAVLVGEAEAFEVVGCALGEVAHGQGHRVEQGVGPLHVDVVGRQFLRHLLFSPLANPVSGGMIPRGRARVMVALGARQGICRLVVKPGADS